MEGQEYRKSSQTTFIPAQSRQQYPGTGHSDSVAPIWDCTEYVQKSTKLGMWCDF